MSRVTFSSLTQADRCVRYLEDLSLAAPGDPCSQVVVVTGTGRVSVSRRLLQLLSPLVREAVASLPMLATLEPLTIILPDTDTSTVEKMMDLLVTGKTNVSNEQSPNSILNLTNCLQIPMRNLDTRKVKEMGKIRVRNISEKLEPEFIIINNNSSKGDKHGEVIEIEDGSDEKDNDNGGIEHGNIETVNDGCTPKPVLKNKIVSTSMEWTISTYTTMVKAAIRAIGGRKGCTIMDIRKYVCANYIVEDTETISSRLRLAIRKGRCFMTLSYSKLIQQMV